MPNLLPEICSSLTEMLQSVFMATNYTHNEITYLEDSDSKNESDSSDSP